MPTYGYKCEACGERQEHRLSFSEHVHTQPCECGGTAEQTYDEMPYVFVKGGQKDIKLTGLDVPIGWDQGNTPDKQEAAYARIIQEKGAAARRNDKAAIKGGIRHLASVPREWVRMRNRQFGADHFDPSAQSAAELKQKLKDDGLAFHKD